MILLYNINRICNCINNLSVGGCGGYILLVTDGVGGGREYFFGGVDAVLVVGACGANVSSIIACVVEV